MDLADVKTGLLQGGIPESLVDQLLETYVEQKRRFHLGDHRPQAVEGGRFCEAGFRIVQHECGLTVTPLSKNLPGISDSTLAQFENATNAPDSARFHIPRALKSIYNIRNKRDAAHLADGIDPNLQDATLIMANMDWVMAELVRLHHGVPASEAQQIIEDLVTREVPAVQEIAGQPVILTDLQPRDAADALQSWRRRSDNRRTVGLAPNYSPRPLAESAQETSREQAGAHARERKRLPHDSRHAGGRRP